MGSRSVGSGMGWEGTLPSVGIEASEVGRPIEDQPSGLGWLQMAVDTLAGNIGKPPPAMRPIAQRMVLRYRYAGSTHLGEPRTMRRL